MKFESFAVTSNGDSNGINQENYFLNGFCKEEISAEEAYDSNISFGKRDIFAVSDGSKSAASGEEAAFLSVNMLRDFLGTDFRYTNESYFVTANNEVAGKIFENGGKEERVDMAVLYINRRRATVYNMGESSVFFFNGEKIRKISGIVPETVETEESVVDEFGNMIIETVEKDTAKLLGADPEMYAVSPHISDEIKITGKSAFLLCTKRITENISQETITEILKNKRANIDEKVSEIMGRAQKDGAQPNATVMLIKAKKGLDFSWFSSKGFIVAILLLIVLLIGITSYDAIYNGLRSFVYEYVWDDKLVENVEVDPWVPQPYDPYKGEYVEQTETPEVVLETPPVSEENDEANTQPPVTQSAPPVNNSSGTQQARPSAQPKPTTPAAQPEQPAVQPPTPAPPVEVQEPQVKTDNAELPIDFT